MESSLIKLFRKNNVEQTDSIAKHIMSDSRKQMDPTSLEMLLILKLNSDLWDEKSANAFIK